MAGVRNQARVAAQLRLRRRVARQDELVRAYFAAEAAVQEAERKLATVRAQCEGRLRQAESARGDSARALSAVLAEVAAELGENRAAEILEVPLSRVRDARRSSPKPQHGKLGVGQEATGDQSATRTMKREQPAGHSPRKVENPPGRLDGSTAADSPVNDSAAG
jgi:hypothetical protein